MNIIGLAFISSCWTASLSTCLGKTTVQCRACRCTGSGQIWNIKNNMEKKNTWRSHTWRSFSTSRGFDSIWISSILVLWTTKKKNEEEIMNSYPAAMFSGLRTSVLLQHVQVFCKGNKRKYQITSQREDPLASNCLYLGSTRITHFLCSFLFLIVKHVKDRRQVVNKCICVFWNAKHFKSAGGKEVGFTESKPAWPLHDRGCILGDVQLLGNQEGFCFLLISSNRLMWEGDNAIR